MADFSIQEFLQQRSARSVSGEELEIYGKHAAQRYAASGGTLSDAVIEEVKQAGLSPEQVKRVVEFANTSAFLQEFNKEGTDHRVVDFHGGPADLAIVLQDLNDGGGGTVFDRGTLDYQSPPPRAKTAAVHEGALREMFSPGSINTIPEENPLGEVVFFRDKVAGLCDHLTAELSGLETIYEDLCNDLYGQVKQATLEGFSMGDVVLAWSTVTEEPVFVKVAFEVVSPRLERDGVFKNALAICESIEKVAENRMVNLEHPLVTGFAEYCDALIKMASTREERDEALVFLKKATDFLVRPEQGDPVAFINSLGVKEAAGGLVGQALRGAEALSGPAASAAQGVGKVLMGPGHGAEALGKAVGGAVKYAPHIAGGAAAIRAAQHLNASGVGNELSSFVPGTQAYQQKQWELQQRYGNNQGYGY